MKHYYVHVNLGNAAMAKTEDYFIAQGGLRESWGKLWKKVEASSLEAARNKAHKVFGVDRRLMCRI